MNYRFSSIRLTNNELYYTTITKSIRDNLQHLNFVDDGGEKI